MTRINIKINRSGGGGSCDIPAKSYRACFTQLKETTRKKYQSEEHEPILRAVYVIQGVTNSDGTEAVLTRDWTDTLDDRSLMKKDLDGMSGEVLTYDWSDDEVGDVINRCLGWDYLVTVAVKESGWRKITSVSQLPDGMPQRETRLVADEQKDIMFGDGRDTVKVGADEDSGKPDVSFEDDDIPF